jgi:putative NIF3 family GTP cyclohydrolase 1 type 2
MYTAEEVAKVFEKIAPLDSGVPGDQLGFVYGNPNTEVRGIACLWNVHTQSIRLCAEQDLNMIICHEEIWHPPQTSPWYKGPTEDCICSNLKRRELLENHGMVVYRSHSNWDALVKDGVHDQAVSSLEIEGLTVVARQKFFAVVELPAPMTVNDLNQRVQQGFGFSGCRLFGDGDKQIRRFSILIGGFGENQFNMPQAAMEMGAEAVIIGEMSEFIMIACLEMGLPVIESLHSISEIPAIRRQAEILSERFSDVKVEYIPSGATAFMSR